MIDQLLDRLLPGWREDEARDLKRKERQLWSKITAAWDRIDKYGQLYATMEKHARARALEVAGITVAEWMPGWPKYHKDGRLVDAWSLPGIIGPYYEAPEYNPPSGPSPAILREHSITVSMIRGYTREQAEEIETKEEAENEKLRLWAIRLGPGIRTVDASCDPRHPMMVSEKVYNQLAGIPGREEIVVLGPA